MEGTSKLTIVIPVYNEEESIGDFLKKLVPLCEKNNYCLIIVNDGSRDKSSSIIDQYSNREFIRAISHKLNRGYGAALKTGLLAVRTRYALTMDGDGQHSVYDVAPTLEFAEKSGADLVIGNREQSTQKTNFRSIGKLLIRFLAKQLMELPITDLNSGFKLYRTDLLLEYLPLCPNTMAFSDIITLLFTNSRQLVLEVPITVHPRRTGKSTINIGTAFETIATILNISIYFNPYKLFLPPAFFCLLFGLVWGIPIVLEGKGVSVGSLLLIFSSAFLFSIALIASQLSSIRMQILEMFHVRRSTEEDKPNYL